MAMNNLTPCDKKHILIVDDEDQTVTALRMMLLEEFPEHALDTAEDGRAAVESFRSNHPAVILMDIEMPIMGGVEALREIEGICETEGWAMPSVIFCVGYNPDAELREIVANSRQHIVLAKPIHWDDLITEVRKWL